MSETGKAVFLSYASQDAEAARKICEALRSGGVEVWFDADGGLEHGDEWDAKIRRQIKECVLFIPVISANTQARHEGYFRIEWDLAAERARGIASGVPFILPVVIDDTREPDALVPDRFRMVQWTKLPGGVVTPEVQARYLKLWSHRTGVLKHEAEVAPASSRPSSPDAGWKPALPPSRGLAVAWIAGIIAVVIAGGASWWMLHNSSTKPAPHAVTPKIAPALSEADQLVARAYALFDKMSYTRDNLAAAEDLTRRSTEIASDSAHAWAARAYVQSCYVLRGWDISEKRRQDTQTFANRALALNPNETDAMLALTYVLNQQGGFVQAEALARRALALGPDSYRLRGALYSAVGGQGRLEEAFKLAAENVRLFPREPLTHYGLALGQLRLGHAEEALASFEAALAVQPFASALLQKTVLLVELRGDLTAARATLNQVAPEDRTEDRAVGIAMWLALLEHNPARVQEAAALTARSYFEDNMVPGAKAWFTALAYQLDGKESLARRQWEVAETVLRQRLRDHPDSTADHAQLAAVLAWLGRDDEAAREIAPLEAMMREQPNPVSAILLAKYYAALGQAARAAPYLSRAMDRYLFISRPTLRLDPQWDKLRGQPEFEALLAVPKQGTAAAAPTDKSVAVLPFVNMSDDKDTTAFFADGVHEDILTSLVGIRDLRVVSRTSVMDYRGTTKKIAQIGNELHVTYVLEGSVRRAGNKVRVTAQLIKAASDEHVWAKNFDRDLTDVFAIQAELAQAIAAELDAKLSPQDQKRLASRPTDNPAAYDLYLKAREILSNAGRVSRDDVARRVSLAEGAVTMDPKFAEAWSELAEAHVSMYSSSLDTTPGRLAKAREALARARALSPNSPVFLRAQGTYYLLGDSDAPKAIEQFERILALQPNDVDCLEQLNVAQRLSERWSDAIRTARALVQLEPGNVARAWGLATLLVSVRRYDDAKAVMLGLRPDAETEQRLAQLEFRSTGSRQALDAFYARLEAAQPGSPLLIEEKIRRAFARKDYTEYDRLLATRTNAGSFDWELWLVMQQGAAMKQRGDVAGAKAKVGQWPATLRARLALEPDNTQWLRGLATLAAIEGNYVEALRCIDRAADIFPFEKDSQRAFAIREIRAWIYLDMGDRARAVDQLAELLRHPSIRLNVHTLAQDPNFSALRDDASFKALLADPKNNAPLF